jgi:universal stress protein E
MKILCATDLLPKSESAIDRAGILAAQLGADLSLLHVVPPTELQEMAEQDLERAKVQLEARVAPPLWRFGPPPHVLVRQGNPALELIETVREAKPDLIVLGRHRPQPLRDFLSGTIAARLLSERKCPVLIVDSLALDAYRKVVLAVDRTQASAEAVRIAEATVLNNGMSAAIVHAYPPAYDGMLIGAGVTGAVIPGDSQDSSPAATVVLRALLMGVTDDVSRYGLIIEHATPAAAIRKVVRRLNPDLLVLGTRGRGRLRRALLGSVANRIVARVHCDVLVVPDPVSVTSRRERIGHRSLDVVTGA